MNRVDVILINQKDHADKMLTSYYLLDQHTHTHTSYEINSNMYKTLSRGQKSEVIQYVSTQIIFKHNT